MKITLELPPDVEAQLHKSVTCRDADAVRSLLAEAFAPTVEGLLRETLEELTDAEFEAVSDQIADELGRCRGPNVPSLSDYAISREGIYADHP